MVMVTDVSFVFPTRRYVREMTFAVPRTKILFSAQETLVFWFRDMGHVYRRGAGLRVCYILRDSLLASRALCNAYALYALCHAIEKTLAPISIYTLAKFFYLN